MKLLESVPVDNIVVSREYRIRTVDKTNDEYKRIEQAIRLKGYNPDPLTVRPFPDDPDKFILIDGEHRLVAMQEIGIAKTAVTVEEMTPVEALATQYAANRYRRKPNKQDEVKAVKFWMKQNPNKKQKQVAEAFGMSDVELSNLLGLENLIDDAWKQHEKGKISATALIHLAKFPIEHQQEHLAAAIEKPVGEFIEYATDQLKQFRSGEAAELGPVVRTKKDLESRWESAHDFFENDPNDYNRGFFEALDWALKMDATSMQERKTRGRPKSIDAQKEKIAKRQKELEELQAELAKAEAAAK